MNGYLRVASVMPSIKVGNPKFNLDAIKEEILKANALSVKLCVLPELCLTGNNLQRLYYDKNILNDSLTCLFSLVTFSSELDMVIIISLPYLYNNNLYEVAAVIKSGDILGFVPKTIYTNEDPNKDYFSVLNIDIENMVLIDAERKIQYNFPFSKNLLFYNENYSFSVNFNLNINKSLKAGICVNIDSIPETVLTDYKIKKIRYMSYELSNIIITSTPGPSESSVLNSYFGRSLICENGNIISKNDIITNKILVSDVDLDSIKINNDFKNEKPFMDIKFSYSNFVSNAVTEKLYRNFDKTPFINKKITPYNYSMHIINILSIALAKRMQATNTNNIVIGVSGGLDSTIALLISKKATEYLSLNSNNIYAYSMPGFGTTNNTNSLTADLLKSLGIRLNVINITNAVNIHFNNIGHDENNLNSTFENAQARERTQVLMDIANDINGIVVGTGDLSEIALGFSTYNGDQMSMYNVNGSLYKTLIKYMINSIAEENLRIKDNILLANTLKNILHSPISPELLPTENGLLLQKTEDILGNYEIHDFILYNYLKYNYDIYKILDLTLRTFVYNDTEHKYTEEYIKNCINVFFKRFYKSQFKRVASPDSPDIGLPNLNSSFNFKMPSDAEIDISV